MKRWGLVVAGLYALVLAVLAFPLQLAAFGPWVKGSEPASQMVKDAIGVYAGWQFWAWIVLMGVCQLALLALPVRVASRRPVDRRALWPTVLGSGLMVGLLAWGACFSIAEGVLGESAGSDPLFPWVAWITLAAMLLVWIGWSVVFLRFSRTAEPRDLIGRLFRWMFRGSVLELLIAVPAHIVARHRGYCCAGFMTFIGLATGIAVMLFAFGPSVFFLFAERWRRLHPQAREGEGA